MSNAVLSKSQELVDKIYENMRMVESCDDLATQLADAELAFIATEDNGDTDLIDVTLVLSDEQRRQIVDYVQGMICGNKVTAETFLGNITGEKKGMQLNPEFEGAVAEMTYHEADAEELPLPEPVAEEVEVSEPVFVQESKKDAPVWAKQERPNVNKANKAFVVANYKKLKDLRGVGLVWRAIAERVGIPAKDSGTLGAVFKKYDEERKVTEPKPARTKTVTVENVERDFDKIVEMRKNKVLWKDIADRLGYVPGSETELLDTTKNVDKARNEGKKG